MNDVVHFAINADDVERARGFYETVLGWTFQPWGPPDFYRITTGGEGAPSGALQVRRDLVPGMRTVGFECTVAVADVRQSASAAVRAGGAVLMDVTTISGVGHLAFVRDPEGNALGLMQYDAAAD